MRKNNAVISLAVAGGIIVAFTTAAFFLLEIEKTALNGWAFSFLLLSEAALFGGLIALAFAPPGHSKVFLRAGVSMALFLYFGLTLLTMLFVRGFTHHLGRFILLESGIIVFFTIVVIAVQVFSRRISADNQKTVTQGKAESHQPKRGGF